MAAILTSRDTIAKRLAFRGVRAPKSSKSLSYAFVPHFCTLKSSHAHLLFPGRSKILKSDVKKFGIETKHIKIRVSGTRTCCEMDLLAELTKYLFLGRKPRRLRFFTPHGGV